MNKILFSLTIVSLVSVSVVSAQTPPYTQVGASLEIGPMGTYQVNNCPDIAIMCLEGTVAKSYIGSDGCTKWMCVPKGSTCPVGCTCEGNRAVCPWQQIPPTTKTCPAGCICEGDTVACKLPGNGQTEPGPTPVQPVPPPIPRPVPQILKFAKGWNLISFYQLPQDKSLRSVFSERQWLDNIDFIRTFEAGKELIYDPKNGVETLKTIEFDNSYSVHAIKDFVMYVYGNGYSVESPKTKLYYINSNYFNYFGYPLSGEMDIEQFFTSLLYEYPSKAFKPKVSLVKDGTGAFWIPGVLENSLKTLKPGQGYQVAVKEDVEFTYPIHIAIGAKPVTEPICKPPCELSGTTCICPTTPPTDVCPAGCICEGNEVKCPITQTIEQITEAKIATENIGPTAVSIGRTQDNRLAVKSGEISAYTTQKLIVEKDKLSMKTSEGDKEIKVLPTTASEKAIEKNAQSVKEIQLEETAAAPVYSVIGAKKARILFAIPITLSIETKVDAATGEIISTKKPWWNFLVF